MQEVVLATRNRGKIEEIKEVLTDVGLLIYSLNDFPGATRVEEDGRDFRENALKKARYTVHFTGKLAVADDSGLEVDALGGKPGVFSARFAGEMATDRENNRKLIEELEGLPQEGRGASFCCVLALVEPSGQEIVIEEECRGLIVHQERGAGGFGYDPLFFFPPLNKTFAELTREEKKRVSHRGKALKKLREILRHKALETGSQ
jgi:XTP/dITP diphosphohydrolase